jgi:hypothetical protein
MAGGYEEESNVFMKFVTPPRALCYESRYAYDARLFPSLVLRPTLRYAPANCSLRRVVQQIPKVRQCLRTRQPVLSISCQRLRNLRQQVCNLCHQVGISC